jgi:hypothetical protein
MNRIVALIFGGESVGETMRQASLPLLLRRGAMEVLHSRCCGIDIHKKSITVCVRSGNRAEKNKRLTSSGPPPRRF